MTRDEARAEAQAIANENDVIMAMWGEHSEFVEGGINYEYCPAERSNSLAKAAIPDTMVLITPEAKGCECALDADCQCPACTTQAMEEQYARAMCGGH